MILVGQLILPWDGEGALAIPLSKAFTIFMVFVIHPGSLHIHGFIIGSTQLDILLINSHETCKQLVDTSFVRIHISEIHSTYCFRQTPDRLGFDTHSSSQRREKKEGIKNQQSQDK